MNARFSSTISPTMGICIAVLGFGLFFTTTPAKADVTGTVCVSDGSHIVVNGRRNYGRCIGGTPVVLADIEVPPLSQTCGDPHGCGTWAAYFLTEMVKGKEVTCEGNARDPKGNVVALCKVDGREINRTMVELGWALPVSFDSPYVADMKSAQENNRGLWNTTRFDPPAKWRGRPAGQ